MAAKKETTDSLSLLKRDLKERKLSSLYFFYGEESYLKHFYLSMLEKQLSDGPAASFNTHRYTPENFSMDALADSVEAIPMMAERSLIRVDEVDPYKLPEADREKLCSVLNGLPEYCCLVFTFDSTPFKPDGRLRKLHEAINKNGKLIEFAKQPERELCDWIIRNFRALGRVIEQPECRYLIYLTGGNMTTMKMEISKIAAFSQGPTVTKADLDAVVDPVLEAVIFKMTDAIGEKRYGDALAQLRDQFRMQQEPIMLLGMIGAQFRKISAAVTLSAAGKGGDALMKLYGMKDYPARKMMGYGRTFSPAFCAAALTACAETDYKLKTSSSGTDKGQRLLELLLLQLSQEAARG